MSERSSRTGIFLCPWENEIMGKILNDGLEGEAAATGG